MLRPLVVSILRVRPELSHLLRFPSLKGPLRPALAYKGVPPLPHTRVPQAKMEVPRHNFYGVCPVSHLLGSTYLFHEP